MASEFAVTFLSAVQATLSVLLTIAVGVAAAQFNFLNGETSRRVSQLSVEVFLPLLLLTNIGSAINLETAVRYLPIFIWALAYSITALFIARAAVILFRLPKWTVAAVTFGNTTSLPLLLVQSLSSTGVLGNLLGSGPDKQDVDMIRSYFLVFAVVMNVLTFGEGERALLGFDEHGFPFAALLGLRKYASDIIERGVRKQDGGSFGSQDGEGPDWRASVSVPSERTLSDGAMEDGTLSERAMEGEPSQTTPLLERQTTSVLPGPISRAPVSLYKSILSMAESVWSFLPDPLKRFLRPMEPFINSTSLGAAAGVVIGLTPPLHRLFFSPMDEGGYFNAWLTTPLKNVGELFITLQVIVVGVRLSLSIRRRKRDRGVGDIPRRALIFVLLMRFIIFPAMSIPIIWSLAKHTNVLNNDPALWFSMMLMPAGPPAMKLLALAEVTNVDEEIEMAIARLLTISYAVTPLISLAVVGALRVSAAVAK